MIKVGILTYHYQINYGAILQAYAIQKTVKDLGFDVRIIDYKNKIYIDLYPPHFRFTLKNKVSKSWLKSLVFSSTTDLDYHFRWERFERFIKKHLNPMPLDDAKDELSNTFDVLLCGSDQIWAYQKKLDGVDETYFGKIGLSYKPRVVSYAASMGTFNHPEKEVERLKELLADMYAISMREPSHCKLVQEKTGFEVKNVLDPTLLLTAKEYEDIMILPKEKQKYLLIYTVGINEELYKIAYSIAKSNNLTVIEILRDRKVFMYKHKKKTTLGPAEFLGYFNQASFVVTNSFHGTTFSIINKKNFFTVPSIKRSARMIDFLTSMNLGDRIVRTFNDFKQMNTSQEVDYKEVYKLLDKRRTDSLSFLETAIKGN